MNRIHKFSQQISNKIFNRADDKENDAPISDSDFEITFDDEERSSGVFVNSLDEFSVDDVILNETAQKAQKIPTTEIIRRIMFWFFLATFIVSFWQLIENIAAKQKGEKIYSQLENEFLSSGFSFDASGDFSPEEGEVKYLASDNEAAATLSMTDRIAGLEQEAGVTSSESSGGYNEELEKMRAGLASLAQINPDIYGWISVAGTSINYPIVQGEDNDYYLDHAYTGDYLPIGSIFADYRNDETITENYNTIFYGHNITSGSMFHDVTKFFDDEYFENTYVYIYTMDGIFVYEPFSIYETRYDYNYFKTSFNSSDDFVSFTEEVKANSAKEKEMEFTADDRIITLSTCTNGAYYARYALHAKLIKTIVD